jgi:hypothetical protein
MNSLIIAPWEKFARRARPLDDLSRVQYIFGSFTPESKIHLGLAESASVFGELQKKNHLRLKKSQSEEKIWAELNR